MTTPAVDILNDIVSTLQAAGAFNQVTLGESNSSTEVPRASVVCDGLDALSPDDSAGGRWYRLRATIVIRTRSLDRSQAVARINTLAQAAIDALLADAHRGGLCQDLPVGPATEIGPARPTRGLKRPEAEITIDIRCHFEQEAGS